MQLIIPAAGRGTRLAPLTDACPKELLPLGGRPALDAALLEADAAGLADVTLVVSPAKPALTAWAAGRLRIAVQAEPRGSLHAVACADPRPPYAILYPDYVHPAGQQALAGLVAAARGRPDATWFGVIWLDAEAAARMGGSARITLADDGRITAVHRDRAGPAWHTAFAEIRGEAHHARLCADPLDDGRLFELLEGLAADGLLYGHRLPAPILDIGIPAGYADACVRFADGRAQWRSA